MFRITGSIFCNMEHSASLWLLKAHLRKHFLKSKGCNYKNINEQLYCDLSSITIPTLVSYISSPCICSDDCCNRHSPKDTVHFGGVI